MNNTANAVSVFTPDECLCKGFSGDERLLCHDQTVDTDEPMHVLCEVCGGTHPFTFEAYVDDPFSDTDVGTKTGSRDRKGH